MWRLWIGGGIIVVLFAALATAAMQVGEWTRPLPPVVAGLVECDPSCWETIIPGQTSRADADQVMLTLGYERQYLLAVQSSRPTEFVTYRSPDGHGCLVTLFYQADHSGKIRLLNCDGLTLGDMMAALGKPDELMPPLTLITAGGQTLISYSIGIGETLSFSFLGGNVIVYVTGGSDPTAPLFLPTSRVVSIELHPQSATANLMPSDCRHTWQGFKPRVRYSPQFSTVLC